MLYFNSWFSVTEAVTTVGQQVTALHLQIVSTLYRFTLQSLGTSEWYEQDEMIVSVDAIFLKC